MAHSKGSVELKLFLALKVYGNLLIVIVLLPTRTGARLSQFFSWIPMSYDSLERPPLVVALILNLCISVKVLKLGISRRSSLSLNLEIT